MNTITSSDLVGQWVLDPAGSGQWFEITAATDETVTIEGYNLRYVAHPDDYSISLPDDWQSDDADWAPSTPILPSPED